MPIDHTLNPDKTLAILIGVSEFIDFQPIKPAVNNVSEFKRVLEDPKIFGVPSDQVKTIVNETSDEIKKQIILHTNEAQKKGIQSLLIYFAGHGYRRSDRSYFLTGTNTEKLMVNEDGSTGINFEFLKNRIRKSRIPQCIFLLDACYSGLAVQGEEKMQDLTVKGTYTLTSSDSQEVSYFDTDGTHTLFTGELLEILKSGVDNGKEMVSLSDLYAELSRNTRKKNPKMSPQQMVSNEIQGNRFQFFRNPAYDEQDALMKRVLGIMEKGKVAYQAFNFREARFSFLDAKDLAEGLEDNTRIRTELDKLIDSSREKEEFAKKLKEANRKKESVPPPTPPPSPEKALKTEPPATPSANPPEKEKSQKTEPSKSQKPKSSPPKAPSKPTSQAEKGKKGNLALKILVPVGIIGLLVAVLTIAGVFGPDTPDQNDPEPYMVPAMESEGPYENPVGPGDESNPSKPGQQTGITQEEIPAFVSMEWNDTRNDFGTVYAKSVVQHKFWFTNTGTAPLIIENVKSSCGCIIPEWSTSAIDPGDKGWIKIEFDTRGKFGKQNKVITVLSNAEGSPHRLTVEADIVRQDGRGS